MPAALAFLLGTVPALTETFVSGEILELRRQGLVVPLFALRRGRGPVQQPDARGLVAETEFALPLWSSRLAGANLTWLRRSPRRYLATLALLIRRTWRNPVHLLKALAVFAKAAELALRLEARGIDHVHAHWASHPTTAALIIGGLTGMSYSFTAHAGDVSLFRTLLGEKLRRARFVLTCTGELGRELAAHAPAAATCIHVNYHGVSRERFTGPPDGRGSGRLLILGCGALLQRKGFDDLVRACGILRRRGRDFRCVIVGEGSHRRALEALIRAEGLGDRVALAGAVAHADVIRHYRRSDVFVLPCRLRPLRLLDLEAGLVKSMEAWFERSGGAIRDGIPNVLVEAMAAGLPVVSTPIAGIPELIRNGRNGLLVPPGRPDELARALEHLLLDPELRRRLGARATEEVAARFDRTRNVAELMEIFGRHLALDLPGPVRVARLVAGGKTR